MSTYQQLFVHITTNTPYQQNSMPAKSPSGAAVVLLPELRPLALRLALLPHLVALAAPPPPLGPLARVLVPAAMVSLPVLGLLALLLAMPPGLAALVRPVPPVLAVPPHAAATGSAPRRTAETLVLSVIPPAEVSRSQDCR